MRRTVLMIAFHFPPAAIGSGHLRTLGFARYLPQFGWDPIVLSARALAYAHTSPSANGSIPDGCRVQRALAFDVSRHFSIAGKYPGWLAQPDRWSSWWPAAVWQGLRLIRRHRIDAIWSTYPIMSAHVIAHTLAKHAGLPWIADFRDPVASSVEADNPFSVAAQQRWERRVLARAQRVVFTTPGARKACAQQQSDMALRERLAVIQNGYDEAAFADLAPSAAGTIERPLVMVHSGLLYQDGRNPLPFLEAVAQLKAVGRLDAADLRVVLRASGWERDYQREIERLGLVNQVTLAPPLPHREALAELAAADALLLFQGDHFDQQIPAKLYEYLRIGRPMFALVGPHGDTAALLRETGGAALAPIDNVDAIAMSLADFVRDLAAGQATRAPVAVVERHSRRAGAALLADMLREVSAQ